MKKWTAESLTVIVGLLVVFSLLVSAGGGVSASAEVRLEIAGRIVESDVPPRIESDRTLVPVRLVSEELGWDVTWMGDSRQILITRDNDLDAGYVLLGIGDRMAVVDDEEYELDVAPSIDNDRTMVPVRFVAEALGVDVQWQADTRTVSLNVPQEDNKEHGTGDEVPDNLLHGITYVNDESFYGLRFDVSGKYEVSKVSEDDDRLTLQVSGVDAADSLTDERKRFSEGPVEQVEVRRGEDRLYVSMYFREETIYSLVADEKAFMLEFSRLYLIEMVPTEGEPQIKLFTSMAVSEPRSFKLSDPARAIVDLQGVALCSGVEDLLVDEGSVKGVRLGRHRKSQGDSFDGTRVVIDLYEEMSPALDVKEQSPGSVISVAWGGEQPSLQGRTIVIDPGHGGDDPGGQAFSDIREKTVVLEISKHIAEVLREDGMDVIMTREGDYTVDIYDRPEIANRANADVFVSVHCNADSRGITEGTETYYYPNGAASEELARVLHAQLVNTLQRPDRGVRYGNFAVLREAKMPAVLLELLYLTSPQEERLLRNPQVQRMIAEAVRDGLVEFLSTR